MRTLSCDICDEEFSADTFEDWFQQMLAHYKQDHADFIANTPKDPEEGAKWMSAARKRFNNA